MLRTIYSMVTTGLITAFYGSASICFSFLPVKTSLPYLMGRYWARCLYFFNGVKVEILNPDNIDLNKPMVIMSTHRSHLDIPAMMGTLEPRLYFVAKASLRKLPIFGFSLERLGMVFIDRSNSDSARDSIARAGEQVREGKAVVMFPEGSRQSKAGVLQPLKKGGFHLALQAREIIMPIAVLGTEKALSRNSRCIHSASVKVVIGRPVNVNADSTVEGLLEETKDELERLIAEYEAG